MAKGDYLEKTRKSESGGNDNAQNPHGASGRYQFVKSTWEGLGYDWKDRFNVDLQEEAMKRYTAQTTSAFKNKFKSEPTDADLYGMHFLGAGAYIKALEKGDKALITDIVSPRAFNANKNVMTKNGKPITVGELKYWLGTKMGAGTSNHAPNEESKELEYTNYNIDTELSGAQGITFQDKEETEKKTAGEKAAEILKEENFLDDFAEVRHQENKMQQEQAPQEELLPDIEVAPIAYAPPELPQQQFQQGGQLPTSSNGLYDYPKQNVIVPTQNGQITMKGINYPVLGVDEHGNSQMMMPNQEYQFKGKTILEIPQFKK